MSFSYAFHEQAQKDYEDSLTWYLERSRQAAAGFMDAVNFALTQICTHPARWRTTYKHYHEIGLKKYPFVIIYSIDHEKKIIMIWKVFHYKRNPKKKFKGLKGI